MNKTLALTFALLFALLSTSSAGKQDFTLVNKTGFDLHEVYLAPHGSEQWQEDVLAKALLPNDGSVKIKFESGDKTKVWDLKVVDKDGKATVWEKLDLLEISKATLRFTGGKATAEVE